MHFIAPVQYFHLTIHVFPGLFDAPYCRTSGRGASLSSPLDPYKAASPADNIIIDSR